MTPKAGTTDTRREPLSRDRILEVALRIADNEGWEALSMRRIAAELDATPMALYNHVPNKDALLAGLAGKLLEEIDLSKMDPSDPAGAIKVGYGEFRRVLLEHPNLVPLLERKGDASPDTMRPIELALSMLQALGFTAEEAVLAHWALTGFTMGHVVWQMTNPLFEESEVAAHIEDHRRRLPASEFPCLHAVLPFIEECDMDAAFEFGIEALIEGFKAKLAARETQQPA